MTKKDPIEVKIASGSRSYGRYAGTTIFVTPEVKRRLGKIKSKRFGDMFKSLENAGFKGGKHLLEILEKKLGKDVKLVLSHEQSVVKDKTVVINFETFDKVSRSQFFAVYRQVGLETAIKFLQQNLSRIAPPSAPPRKKETEQVIAVLPEAVRSVSRKKTNELVEKVAEVLQKEKVDISALSEIQAAANQVFYRKRVSKLEERIDKKYPETKGKDSWQSWIYANNWLFGSRYLKPIEKRRVGLDQIPDFLFPTTDGFLDVLEIKLPDKEVIREDTNHPGSFYWSPDVSEAIGQATNYLYQLELHQLEIEKKLKLSTIKPRAIILIGKSQGWDNEKREALRKLNFTLHGIEILTYHQLLERGKQLVAIYDEKS